jgi:hypothetical protein
MRAYFGGFMPNASDDFYAQQREALRVLTALYNQHRHLYERQRLLNIERLGIWRQILRQHELEALAELQAQLLDITGQLSGVRLELEDLQAQTTQVQFAYELRRQRGYEFRRWDDERPEG